ncbi:MAG: hypothetical protein HFF09_01475 [Oscillospiraceae bacterium]|nr:hypothetical protein [Oscillospiraceae bacterium]
MCERDASVLPWDVFEGGAAAERELRLSERELAALRLEYPNAAVEKLPFDGGDKRWYLVKLEGATANHG